MKRLYCLFFLFSVAIISYSKTTIGDDSLFMAVDSVGMEEKPAFEYSYSPKKLILPLALTGVGALAINNGFLVKEKKKFHDEMQKISGGHTTNIDSYLRYLPTALSLVLPYIVSNTKLESRDRWVLRFNAYFLMGALTYGTKKIVSEYRPNDTSDDSFPSGHCATSFMAAEIIRIEYGGWYGIGAYTVACGVGFLRMYNNEHWFNDVIAGAGVGILSARLGYWMLPLERKIFGWNKSQQNKTNIVALPYYNILGGGQLGATLAIRF